MQYIQFPPTQSTVFVVEDQAINQAILSNITKSINSMITVMCFDNTEEALIEAQHSQPDMVLTDYKIPKIGGERFITELRNNVYCRDIPIIVITVLDDLGTRYKALEAGATDVMIKPVDPYECKIRFRHLLAKHKEKIVCDNRTSLLEDRIQSIAKELLLQERETLTRLAKAGEYKNNITGNHLIRVGQFAKIIAQGIGLDLHTTMILTEAATIHDIGKIGIPDSILLKNAPLNKEEFEIIKQHPYMGYEILKNSSSPYLKMGSIIALQHHEKFDGSGYPLGLKADEIEIESRIATVADVFDALISERPYKKAWDFDDAVNYLKANNGSHFDPACIKAFVSQIDTILEAIAASKNNLQTH